MAIMNNATYTMKMPTNYIEMDSSEMQYDGGWSWKATLWTCVAAAALGTIIAAAAAMPLAAGIVVGTIAFGVGCFAAAKLGMELQREWNSPPSGSGV